MVNNQAVLSAQGQYVNLPSGLLGEHTAVSLEVWVTTGVNSVNGGCCPRIFQFGEILTSDTDTNSVLLYRNRGDSSSQMGLYIAATDSYYATNVPFDGQTMHVVVTLAQGDYPRVYVNGVLRSSSQSVTSMLPPSFVFYLGKSFHPAEPTLVGSYDEFRVWGGKLSAQQVSAHFAEGPGESLQSISMVVLLKF